MKRKTKYTDKELAEAHVFPSQLSAADKIQLEKEVTDFRNEQIKNRSENETALSKKLQLKYKID